MKKNKAQKLSTNAPVAHSPIQKNEILKKEPTFFENLPSILNNVPQPFELIRFDKKLNIFFLS